MATVKELIEYLQKLPQDAIVRVVEGDDYGYSYVTNEVDIDFENNVDFIDLTGNPLIREDDKRYNKKYLTLGFK